MSLTVLSNVLWYFTITVKEMFGYFTVQEELTHLLQAVCVEELHLNNVKMLIFENWHHFKYLLYPYYILF